jgi:hypothetical protein
VSRITYMKNWVSQRHLWEKWLQWSVQHLILLRGLLHLARILTWPSALHQADLQLLVGYCSSPTWSLFASCQGQFPASFSLPRMTWEYIESCWVWLDLHGADRLFNWQQGQGTSLAYPNKLDMVGYRIICNIPSSCKTPVSPPPNPDTWTIAGRQLSTILTKRTARMASA